MRLLKFGILRGLSIIVFISCRDGAHVESEVTIGIKKQMDFNQISYDSMRNFYNSDSSFLNVLSDKVASRDSNAVKVEKLLKLSFEERNSAGLNDSEIGSMVAAFRISKSVLDKFTDIEKSLPKEDAIQTGMEADSILKPLKEIKLEVSEN